MLERVYKFTYSEEKLIERIVDDENAVINHIVLPGHSGLPEHITNSHVYLIITSGALTVELNGEPENVYEAGTIVNIPNKTNMFINNYLDSALEFFIVKAPNPRNMG